MRTVVKVDIQTYQITYKGLALVGATMISEDLIYESESIAIRNWKYQNASQNTARQ